MMNINPNQILNQILNNAQAMQNPMIKNAVNMYQSGDSAGLQKMAENICKERGINLNDAVNQVKAQFGIK